MSGIGRTIKVKRAYNVQYANPIVVQAGENLTVGRTDENFPGWRWCTAQDGRQGWVPEDFLSSAKPQSIILMDYSARELQVVPGEEVTVEDARHGWLMVRNMKGDCGWIPADCLQANHPGLAQHQKPAREERYARKGGTFCGDSTSDEREKAYLPGVGGKARSKRDHGGKDHVRRRDSSKHLESKNHKSVHRMLLRETPKS